MDRHTISWPVKGFPNDPSGALLIRGFADADAELFSLIRIYAQAGGAGQLGRATGPQFFDQKRPYLHQGIVELLLDRY